METETQVEVGSRVHNEEKLRSTRVELAEGTVSIQELAGQVFYCPMGDCRDQTDGGNLL